jgi:hypothetical protein
MVSSQIIQIDEVTEALLLCDGKLLIPFQESEKELEFKYNGKTQEFVIPAMYVHGM